MRQPTELIHESDEIYLKFGADTSIYGVDKEKEIREIRRKAISANLKLIECPIRHLGTEEGYKIYSRLQEHLVEAGVEIRFDTMVEDLIVEGGRAVGVLTEKGEDIPCRRDRLQQSDVKEQTGLHISVKSTKLRQRYGTVDVGVRVEVRDEVMDVLNAQSL